MSLSEGGGGRGECPLSEAMFSSLRGGRCSRRRGAARKDKSVEKKLINRAITVFVLQHNAYGRASNSL